MTKENKVYKGIAAMLFLFIFTYLLIRVFYNELMADEIFTLQFYVYRGDFWGETIFWDANNHLLNSFVCHHLYPLFKNNFELYRLPNLIAFILYFFGIVELNKGFSNNVLKILSLITFCSIPFIIECFAYCRGYGLSIAFFVWSLVHIKRFLERNKIQHIAFTYIFLILTVAANLTFIHTSFLIVLAFIIFQLFQFKREKWYIFLLGILFHILFVWAIVPFIEFSFELKERGALYIGGTGGLWAITGNTLTHSIFYTDYSMNFIKYLYLGIFGIMIAVFFRKGFRNKIQETIKHSYSLYIYLFFGTITGIIAMGEILKVNYPPDRSAFSLVILFLLLVLHLLDQLKTGKYIQYALLIFPLLFCFHVSIHSSNLILGNRLSHSFYLTVKNYLKPNQSIAYDPMLRWNWMNYEVNESKKSTVAAFFNPNDIHTDVVILKKADLKNTTLLKHYKRIASDHVNETYAYARKKQGLKIEKYGSPIKSFPLENKEFYGSLEYGSLQKFKDKYLEISVKGHLKTFEKKNRLLLVVQTIDSTGTLKKIMNYEFESIFLGKPINTFFQHNFSLGKITEGESKVIVFIWNQKLERVKLDGMHFRILTVAEDEK